MDANEVKRLIKQWVTIEEELRKIKEEHKIINKKFKDKKEYLLKEQERIKDPILQLMTKIDTESIDVSDDLCIKSKQICKTTGVTKDYMKQRISEYYSDNASSYQTLLRTFVNQYNVNVTDEQLSHYISQYSINEVDKLYEYIVDITPRKVFYDDEKLSLLKRKKNKK